MAEGRTGLASGPGQLPPPAFTEHNFCWDLETVSWGPFTVPRGLTVAVPGQPSLSLFFFFFCFLKPHPQHMEILKLGVESELQLPVYATAMAMRDP